ncbi:unnamed protein product [Brassica oleracea var. botrytis]
MAMKSVESTRSLQWLNCFLRRLSLLTGIRARFVLLVRNLDVLARVYTMKTEIMQIKEEFGIQNNREVAISVLTVLTLDCISQRMMINDKRIKEYRRIQDMKVMETRKTVLQKEQRMLFARALAAGFKVVDMLTLISSAKLFWNLTFDVRKFNIFRYSFIVLMCENRPLQAINGLQEFRRESASHYVCSLVMWFRKFAMHFLEGFSSSDLNQRLFDNQVYGVVHGLLMGHRENLWPQAQSLFIKVKEMDG